MSFKTILVPLDGGNLNQAVLATALMAARRFGAHMEVLYVGTGASEARHYYAAQNLPERWKKMVLEAVERNTGEHAAQVRTAFEQFCRDNEVAIAAKPPASGKMTAAWREETGYEGEVLVRRGRLSDLIFVARPADSPASSPTLETALLDTRRPVVVVPPAPQQCIASRITIGWNASAEAARAVSEAMSCLAEADNVTVLVSQKRAASAAELVDYLGWHGVKPDVKIFEAGSRSVGETLLAESRALAADLLVIGGYTHTRARQLLFGGVTRHVLEAADIPVLMAH